MPSLRIAYLINQYPKVSHSFIRTEILALEAGGIDVVRLAIRGWDAELVDVADVSEREKTRYLLAGGVTALLLAFFATLFRTPGRLFAALYLALQMARGGERSLPVHLVYVLEACLAVRIIKRAGASHIHAHFGSNSAEVAMLSALIGAFPYSFTVHGPEEFDKPFQWKLREKIRRAAFVVAITSFCRSQLYRFADPNDWGKIEIVHCGLDDRFLDAAVTSVPSENRLVCVGRLCEQKGQLLLVGATSALAARGIDIHLTLAGDGEMRNELEAAIIRHGLTERVKISGWVTSAEIRTLLKDSKGLVLPSFAEGLPVVIMEAMAMARPVLSTVIAGIPELVRDEVDGWLVTAGDELALAAAMERLLRAGPDELDAMGTSGKSRVAYRHSASIEASKLATLFASHAHRR